MLAAAQNLPKGHPNRKSAHDIVDFINFRMGANLSAQHNSETRRNEKRRALWTLFASINDWFSQWRDTLLLLEFARVKEANENAPGELVFS